MIMQGLRDYISHLDFNNDAHTFRAWHGRKLPRLDGIHTFDLIDVRRIYSCLQRKQIFTGSPAYTPF